MIEAFANIATQDGLGKPELLAGGISQALITTAAGLAIAIPTQALAYKIGALTIQRLRKKAGSELGDKFDIREFHNQVLNTGALPLSVLEAKIDRWIESQK
jgi:uncharacterized protein (DUF885 family)